MSESRPVRGIVLGHGALAEGLVDAVRQITGVDDALIPLSNRAASPEAVAARVEEALGDGPAIVFTDMQAGSCGFAARRLCHGRTGVAVVSGVNLPLLLDFVMQRHLPLQELVPRLLLRGRAGICCAPVDLEDHAGRAVSGR